MAQVPRHGQADHADNVEPLHMLEDHRWAVGHRNEPQLPEALLHPRRVSVHVGLHVGRRVFLIDVLNEGLQEGALHRVAESDELRQHHLLVDRVMSEARRADGLTVPAGHQVLGLVLRQLQIAALQPQAAEDLPVHAATEADAQQPVHVLFLGLQHLQSIVNRVALGLRVHNEVRRQAAPLQRQAPQRVDRGYGARVVAAQGPCGVAE